MHRESGRNKFLSFNGKNVLKSPETEKAFLEKVLSVSMVLSF